MIMKKIFLSSLLILIAAIGLVWSYVDSTIQYPGGSNTNVQYNDNDEFGGEAAFTYDETGNRLTVSTVSAQFIDVTTISARTYYGDGSNLTGIVGGSGGGPQSSFAGSIATGSVNMNQYSVLNSTNLLDIDRSTQTKSGGLKLAGVELRDSVQPIWFNPAGTNDWKITPLLGVSPDMLVIQYRPNETGSKNLFALSQNKAGFSDTTTGWLADTLSSLVDVVGGSITVRGSNAGIYSSGDICSSGTFRGDGSGLTGITAGGGGGGGQIKVVIDSGTVFTTVSTINVTHADFTSAFTAATWTVRLSSNVARRDSDQIFFGSNTFLNNLTISTGNLTLVPPYPVLGIGTGFYGNPSGIRTMLESRANYTQGFVENAIRNPSTTDGTGVAYRLSNDDFNGISSRYGLTASLNTAFPSVAFIQHPTNGLHIGNSAPTAGGSPVFVKSYVNQSNVSMVGIGTAAPQSLIHIVSTPGSVIPLVIVSSASNVSFSGRLFEIDRSSIQMNIPVYVSSITSLGTITGIHRGDGSGLTGISAVADQSSTYTWTGTHNYKGRISMQNATPIDDLTVTPNLYSLTFAPVPANGVQPAIYGFAINTGNIPAFFGHAIGVLGRSSDTENGHTYLFGVEGRNDIMGDSVYRGVLGYNFAKFHLATGSTATLYAVEARSEVFDADGVTPKSTATVASVYIPAIVGGASDRKWSIFQSGLTDPAYFGSPVGIGVQRPFGTGTKLHIGDASNPTMIIADTDNGVSFSLGASGLAGGYTFVISTTSHPLLFGVNNSEAFRVDTAKNIGINTTVPTQKMSVVGTVDVSSMMVYGTVTSTSGFVGDGSKLTGITASAVQSLPLIAGDTGYAAIYTTKTWSAAQTFISSITVISSSIIAGVIFSNSTAEEPPYVSRATGSIIATNINIMPSSDQNNLCGLNIWDKSGNLRLNTQAVDGELHVSDFGGGPLDMTLDSMYNGVSPQTGQKNGMRMKNYSSTNGNFKSIISQNAMGSQTAGIYFVNVTSAGAFGNAYGAGSRLGRILFYTGTAADDFVTERGRFDEYGNFVVGDGTGSSKMDVKTGSITVRGTGAGIYSSGDICSSGTFRGDGSKLTGITATSIQSLPLIAGDTGYFAIYSTRSISATQTFQSSVTFSSTSLSIGGNLYHFQSSAPAVNTVLRYDAGGKVFWGKDGGGGGTGVTYNQVFGAAQANLLSVASSPYISNSTMSASAGLFYDETSTQTATWSTILTGYQGGQLSADIIYTSSATSGTVNWGVYVECKSVDEVINYDSNDFDVVNSTSVTVGSTSMMPMKATAVLTNNDSCADGDILRIKLERIAGQSDTAMGKARMRFMRIYE